MVRIISPQDWALGEIDKAMMDACLLIEKGEEDGPPVSPMDWDKQTISRGEAEKIVTDLREKVQATIKYAFKVDQQAGYPILPVEEETEGPF